MIFLYYVSGATEATIKESPAFTDGGLQIVFSDCLENLAFAQSKGPDGAEGLLFYALPTSREKPFGLRFRPSDQTWIDCGTHWLGIQDDCPPQPEGLIRKKTLDSYRYTMADNREWMCPKIRRGNHPLVPAYWKVNKGLFRVEVKEDFVDIWEASAEWDSRVRAISYGEAFSICAMCLGLNYRLGPDEISALNMLDASTSRDVIFAALDQQFFLDMMSQKKTLDETTSDESEN